MPTYKKVLTTTPKKTYVQKRKGVVTNKEQEHVVERKKIFDTIIATMYTKIHKKKTLQSEEMKTHNVTKKRSNF